LIAQSDEHTEMVRTLEEQYDSGHDGFEEDYDEESMDESELPSGDELIEELERYLRGEADE
jgi:translation initiation factor 2 alpha subunit (eIF-2alpha)